MTLCAACGLPGHRYGRNEGMDRFDPIACINQLRGELEKRTLPGFAPCETCEDGLEYPTPSFSESHPLPVPCPSCGGAGQVPDDNTVERVAWMLALRLGHTVASIKPAKAGPNTLSMARAALLAYARHTQETKP